MKEDYSYLKNLTLAELVYLAKIQVEDLQKSNKKILDIFEETDKLRKKNNNE